MTITLGVNFVVATVVVVGGTVVVVGAAVVVVGRGATVVVVGRGGTVGGTVMRGSVVVVVTGDFGARGTMATLLRSLTALPMIAVIQQCVSRAGGNTTVASLRPPNSRRTLARSMRMTDSADD